MPDTALRYLLGRPMGSILPTNGPSDKPGTITACCEYPKPRIHLVAGADPLDARFARLRWRGGVHVAQHVTKFVCGYSRGLERLDRCDRYPSQLRHRTAIPQLRRGILPH